MDSIKCAAWNKLLVFLFLTGLVLLENNNKKNSNYSFRHVFSVWHSLTSSHMKSDWRQILVQGEEASAV